MKQTPPKINPSGPAEIAEVDGHFRGVRAGNKVDGPEQIEEFLFADPAAAANHLVFHDGDMRGRTAKSSQSQPQKEDRCLAQVRPLGFWRRLDHRSRHAFGVNLARS